MKYMMAFICVYFLSHGIEKQVNVHPLEYGIGKRVNNQLYVATLSYIGMSILFADTIIYLDMQIVL